MYCKHKQKVKRKKNELSKYSRGDLMHHRKIKQSSLKIEFPKSKDKIQLLLTIHVTIIMLQVKNVR